MKTWLLVLLVAFSVIAGFKVVSYQQKLDHSKVEHERLSDVLARSRSTQTSELKIIKPINKVKKKERLLMCRRLIKICFTFLIHRRTSNYSPLIISPVLKSLARLWVYLLARRMNSTMQ